jgi:hypothetical protein
MQTRKDPNAKEEKVLNLISYKLMHSLSSKLPSQTKFFKYKTCQGLRRALIGVVAKTPRTAVLPKCMADTAN